MAYASLRRRRRGVLLVLAALSVRASGVVTEIADGQIVEYELKHAEKWHWYILPTGESAGCAASLVVQRGDQDN